jgi:PAS domain S-box-containing protein
VENRIINALPALVWTALPDGHVDFLNQRWCEYTGLSADDARGFGWQTAIHPNDLPELLERWRSILASGEAGEMEARLRRSDGEYRWFVVRSSPMRDEAGQRIVKWCGTSTDIDDRKRAEGVLAGEDHDGQLEYIGAVQDVTQRRSSEEALDKARSELSHLARVTRLGVLTASIAHELTQPLSGIITNATTCMRMLGADPPNLEGARETARRTIRDANRASEVVTRLRALFCKKEVTAESVDLNDATREVIALSLSRLQRNRVILRRDFAEDLPLVTGDRVQLQQVILNLLRNASDAMSAVDDRPRELLIRTERDEGDRVRLSVKDAGVGFTPQAADSLFEAFYTTKSDGMGIGLSISRSIIEAHHGRLWATTNNGSGATISFAIPCTRKSLADAETSVNQTDPVTGAA